MLAPKNPRNNKKESHSRAWPENPENPIVIPNLRAVFLLCHSRAWPENPIRITIPTDNSVRTAVLPHWVSLCLNLKFVPQARFQIAIFSGLTRESKPHCNGYSQQVRVWRIFFIMSSSDLIRRSNPYGYSQWMRVWQCYGARMTKKNGFFGRSIPLKMTGKRQSIILKRQRTTKFSITGNRISSDILSN